MDEVTSTPQSVANDKIAAEIKSWISPISDVEEERKRQDEFEQKFRQMQRDYRGENDFGTKPKDFHVPTKRKFWEFWK